MQSQVVMLVDVVGSGAVDATTALVDLRRLLKSAFTESRIDWDRCAVETRGTGVRILVPPDLPHGRLADLLPKILLAELQRYNSVRSIEAAVKLRVALHSGDALEEASQIVGAVDAESMLGQSSAQLMLLLSESFYQDVVVRDAAAEPESFRQSAGAWLRVIDADPFVGRAAEQTWLAQLDTLRTRNRAAHGLLEVCAFLAPRPIPFHWFVDVGEFSSLPDLSRALADPALHGRVLQDVDSSGLGFVSRPGDTVQVHPMLQMTLRNRMAPGHRAEMRRAAHRLLISLDPAALNTEEHWSRYRELLPHAYASGLVGSEDDRGRTLVLNLVRYLYFAGDLEEAAGLAERAYTDWTARLGESDALEAASLLGLARWALARYEDAAEVNQTILEARRRTLDENAEGTIMAELGEALDKRTSGDFQGALELLKDIFERTVRTLGAGHGVTLLTAHSYAVGARLCGDYRLALQLNEQTYRDRASLLGEESPDTLNTLSGVYMDQRELGDYENSLQGHVTIANQVRERLGEDAPDTLRRFAYLAVALRKAGKYPEALEVSDRTLQRFRRRYGTDHPSVLACATAYALDLRNNQQLHDAREVADHVLDRYRASLGADHPHTLAAMANVAVLRRLDGDLEGALRLNTRTLEHFGSRLGEDHPHAIACAINRASDLAALRRFDTAREASAAALTLARRRLGPDHPTTLAAALNNALDQRDAGTAGWEGTYTEVLERYRGVLPGHPATLTAAEGYRADCDIDPLPL
jgi:tetratricopeptide (TPR) repeat protein